MCENDDRCTLQHIDSDWQPIENGLVEEVTHVCQLQLKKQELIYQCREELGQCTEVGVLTDTGKDDTHIG